MVHRSCSLDTEEGPCNCCVPGLQVCAYTVPCRYGGRLQGSPTITPGGRPGHFQGQSAPDARKLAKCQRTTKRQSKEIYNVLANHVDFSQRVRVECWHLIGIQTMSNFATCPKTRLNPFLHTLDICCASNLRLGPQ